MILCPNCKAQLADDAKFCTTCGQKIEAPKPQQPQPQFQQFQQPQPQQQPQFQQFQQPQPQYQAPQYQQPQQTYVSPSDKTAQFDASDIQEHKLIAALAYLNLFYILLVFVAAPNSKYARFHANQGLALNVCMMLLALVNIIPILGWIVFGIASIVMLVFTIMGFVNALTGKAKEVPLVGGIKFFRY
ncbi:MAG: zinc-ribbon domain-containing protein [Ruminococcaceae bacterium]|nr:zinc-ribbon domain-containing protein [Oscillospiraceae bacterium]